MKMHLIKNAPDYQSNDLTLCKVYNLEVETRLTTRGPALRQTSESRNTQYRNAVWWVYHSLAGSSHTVLSTRSPAKDDTLLSTIIRSKKSKVTWNESILFWLKMYQWSFKCRLNQNLQLSKHAQPYSLMKMVSQLLKSFWGYTQFRYLPGLFLSTLFWRRETAN